MKKTIVSALAALTGVAIGASAAGKVSSDKRKIVQQMSNKHLSLFLDDEPVGKGKARRKKSCIISRKKWVSENCYLWYELRRRNFNQ